MSFLLICINLVYIYIYIYIYINDYEMVDQHSIYFALLYYTWKTQVEKESKSVSLEKD